MAEKRYYLAIDLGAESGRGMLGTFDGERLELEEVHRFPNQPVRLLETLYWDFPRIFQEVKTAVARGAARTGGELTALGVDSWGVDYGLLSPPGTLLENPIHYRDSRTDGIMEEVFRKISRRDIFQETGIQFLQLNTIFQLFAHKRADPGALAGSRRFLPIADLVNYFLTGRAVSEYTLATTTQLYDVQNGRWSRRIMEALDYPESLFPEVVSPGTVVGSLREDIAGECGLQRPSPVVAPACLDTGAAVAAVPAEASTAWGYVSSGTWSLMGIELDRPQVTGEALSGNFTNEGGVSGTIRFLRNIMGLWLVQESRRQWAREGRDLDYSALTGLAEKATPLKSLVAPDDPSFFSPGDMPASIREFCRRTSQPVPESEGAVVRCALESLALAYRLTAEKIESITGKSIERLHVVGGGSQNRLLNRFTASALGLPVVAGPVEATATGNALMQAMALRDIPDLAALRKVVRSSLDTETFSPRDGDRDAWGEAYERFKKIAI